MANASKGLGDDFDNEFDDISGDFSTDFNLFDEEFGGNESGIEDLYRVKFNAGINENVKFIGLEWEATDTYKMVKAKFENFDKWEESFPMFVPDQKKYVDKHGTEVTSWFPKKMYDVNKLPIDDDTQFRRRHFGGINVKEENGKNKKDAATNKYVYRNETEDEAKTRKIIEFKQKLNSFLAVFCRDNIKEAMEYIASKGRVANWNDYVNRIGEAIERFCPTYATQPLRLKLHRRYDKSTSNGRSEKYLELPETLEYGLFLEKMCAKDLSVISINASEEKRLIAAPTAQDTQAGLNNAQNIPGIAQNAMPTMIGGIHLPNQMLPNAMPNLPQKQ